MNKILYRVKFKKKHPYDFFVYDNNNQMIFSCFCFTTLVYFFRDRNIDYKSIKFNCTLDDLFRCCIDYDSVEKHIKYRDAELKRKEILTECSK